MLSFEASIHGNDPKTALPVTFDDTLTALKSLERFFIEPDGSFVWTGCTPDNQAWHAVRGTNSICCSARWVGRRQD
jgi:hypothetical protein